MMIISRHQIGKVLAACADQLRLERTERGRPTGPAVGKDRVTLSDRATEVALAREVLKDVPEVRHERVQELRKLVSEGKYRVSAEEIAEKIIGRTVADRIH